jgi:hypothetical protein
MPINTLDPDESQDLLCHFIGTIEQGIWSTPLQQAPADNKPDFEGADDLRLYHVVRIDDVLQSDYDGNIPATLTTPWTIGSGWWAEDNGRFAHHNEDAPDEEIERGDAQPRKFKVTSLWGSFLKMIATGDGYDNERRDVIVMDNDGEVEYDLTPLYDYLVANDLVDTRDASILNGCQFEYRGLGLKYKGSDFAVRVRPYPVKFLGVDGDVSMGSGDSNRPAEVPSINVAADPSTWVQLGATDQLADTLVKLANAASSHTAFSKNALLLPEVKEDEGLQEGILNEANWTG